MTLESNSIADWRWTSTQPSLIAGFEQWVYTPGALIPRKSPYCYFLPIFSSRWHEGSALHDILKLEQELAFETTPTLTTPYRCTPRCCMHTESTSRRNEDSASHRWQQHSGTSKWSSEQTAKWSILIRSRLIGKSCRVECKSDEEAKMDQNKNKE